MQGPGTALHRPRLARLPPHQGLRLQRRPQDGAHWRHLHQPQQCHHPRRRTGRRMAHARLQGQVCRRDSHRADLLRHPPQGREARRREAERVCTARRTEPSRGRAARSPREHPHQEEAAAIRPHCHSLFARKHPRAPRTAGRACWSTRTRLSTPPPGARSTTCARRFSRQCRASSQPHSTPAPAATTGCLHAAKPAHIEPQPRPAQRQLRHVVRSAQAIRGEACGCPASTRYRPSTWPDHVTG
jgi:hypothetical protein